MNSAESYRTMHVGTIRKHSPKSAISAAHITDPVKPSQLVCTVSSDFIFRAILIFAKRFWENHPDVSHIMWPKMAIFQRNKKS